MISIYVTTFCASYYNISNERQRDTERDVCDLESKLGVDGGMKDKQRKRYSVSSVWMSHVVATQIQITASSVYFM